MNGRKTTGAVVMSAIMIIGIYTLILNNSNKSGIENSLAANPEPLQQSTPTTPRQSAEGDLKVKTDKEPADTKPSEVGSGVKVQKYNEGTFAADIVFPSPAGDENLGVKLEIEGDQITSVDTSFQASHDHSQAIQDKLFAPGIGGAVVGKNIEEADLRFVVNGASLHSIAFNDALKRIREEALRTSHNLSFNSGS